MKLLLLWIAGFFSQGRVPIDSGLELANNSADECKECHRAAYAEWSRSRHAKAWTNDFFQYDYRSNPRQWCRNCHIPLRAQQGSSDAALALRDEGVNCIVCHVRSGVFYASHKRENSPHNTVADKSFTDERFCEGCHQFAFPNFTGQGDGHVGSPVQYTDNPMQDTVAQFRRGPYAKSHTCRSCHARTPGKHLYAGSHDLNMLRTAIDFSLCRESEPGKHQGKLRTTLTNRGAGHNVPTGDVHRHLLVKAWRSTAPEKLKEAFYGRRFRPLQTGGKETIWDSSLPPNTYRQWRFDPTSLGGDPKEAVNIEVQYVYGGLESYRPPFSEEPHNLVYRRRRAVSEIASCLSP